MTLCLIADAAAGETGRRIPTGAVAEAALPVPAADLDPTTLAERGASVMLEKARMARDLAAVEREREAALDQLRAMSAAFGSDPEAMATTDVEAAVLASEIDALEAELGALSAGSEVAAPDAWARRWRMEVTEMRLKNLKARAAAMSGHVKAWIGDRLASVEGLLDGAGADTGALLARLEPDGGDPGAQGGPLEPLAAADALEFAAFGPHEGTPPVTVLSDEVRRLAAANRLLETLPLMAPIEGARMTSRYGVRRDPIARRRAVHRGLDFAAPEGTPIHATAPGIVLRAAKQGAYGLLVEIDHGLGVATRYAHLSAIGVAPGEAVAEGQAIGVIGSTGRSTGRHLHYEILIDGRHVNPQGFLQAGNELAAMFGGAG